MTERAFSGWSPASQAIDASAGYGKTQILGLRILAMLLAGSSPGEFTAMTFSRAAAAEICDRLLLILSGALTSTGGMEELKCQFRRELGTDAFDGVGEKELSAVLEKLIRELPRLRISTLDSFFMTLVKCFPFELGVPGGAELLPEESADSVRGTLLRRLFSGGGFDAEFAALCREMMFGEEQKSLYSVCCAVLRDLDPFYRFRRVPELWGGPWMKLKSASPEKLAEALRRCDEAFAENGKYAEKLRPMLARCRLAADPDTRFTRREAEVLRKFLAVVGTFPDDKPEGFVRGWDYAAAKDDILLLVEQGGRLLLHQAARRTAALRGWYLRWCGLYASELWRRGKLQFADLPKLLHDDDPFSRGDGTGEEWRCEIEYRMNSRFRHFLLDEFQDTSREQWAVLAPMTADSGDGDHSLFLVGDVKQAIYGWRSGDSRLIGEVSRGMPNRGLEFSHRYGGAICGAINELFGRIVPESGLIPAPVRKRWSDPRCFRPHAAAGERPGRFVVTAILPRGGEAEEEKYSVSAARLILARLRELKFRERGLNCAVLVRSRTEGIALRNAMAELEPEFAERIIWEGNEKVAGDPLVSALLAVLVAVRHPAETLAVETAEMYPGLGELLPSTPEEFADAGALLDTGIAPFLLDLRRRLNLLRARKGAELRLPPENADNLDLLFASAAEFDAGNPEGTVRDFRAMMLRRFRVGTAQNGTLRMLTVHHSKGLTFDVVFHPLPNSASRPLNLRKPDYRGFLAGPEDAEGTPEWILYDTHAEEGAVDPRLRAAAETRHEERVLEELCVLYVALTRAKYETVAILPPLAGGKLKHFHPEFSSSRKFRPLPVAGIADASWYLGDVIFEGFFAAAAPVEKPLPAREIAGVRVLTRTFGGEWSSGGSSAPAAVSPLPPPEPAGTEAPAPFRITPSAETEEQPELFFALPPENGGGTDFGTRLHEWFARAERFAAAPLPDDPELAAEIVRCRTSPEIRAVLDETADEVWRERPFDVLIDDPERGRVQMSGCFDRVHLRRDAAGRTLHARIIDYKSNRSGTVAELTRHYAPQMRCYRAALSELLALDPAAIRCTLVFTRFASVVEL